MQHAVYTEVDMADAEMSIYGFIFKLWDDDDDKKDEEKAMGAWMHSIGARSCGIVMWAASQKPI